MKAKRAMRRRPLALVLALAAAMSASGACADGGPAGPDFEALGVELTVIETRAGAAHLAGGVDVVWNGGKGAGAPVDPDRVAHAELNAFADVPAGDPGPGSFTYRVTNGDGTVHREIGVTLTWAGFDDPAAGSFRFVGVVVSDTKPCGGSEPGGGGCSHDDPDGCDHDDGGGCSHDDPDGCDHDDGGSCSGGGHESPGGSGGPGGHVSGSDCRIGQVLIGWALDGGTPAVRGDRVSWKWLAPDAPKVLAIQAAIAAGTEIPWPCSLCEKQILGGNLVLSNR